MPASLVRNLCTSASWRSCCHISIIGKLPHQHPSRPSATSASLHTRPQPRHMSAPTCQHYIFVGQNFCAVCVRGFGGDPLILLCFPSIFGVFKRVWRGCSLFQAEEIEENFLMETLCMYLYATCLSATKSYKGLARESRLWTVQVAHLRACAICTVQFG